MLKEMKVFTGILMAILVAILGGCAHRGESSGEHNKLTLINAKLIDGISSEIQENAMVILQGERILYAGPMKDNLMEDGSLVIDVKGATILPGLINTHIHQGYDPEILQAFAQAGVTTVRDLQNANLDAIDNWSWFEQRDELHMDPRNSQLVAVGPMLTVPQGYPIYMNEFLEAMGEPITEYAMPLESAEQAEDVTLRLIQAGADAIKIAIENGVTYLTPETLGFRLPRPSEDMLRAIVDTAKSHNVPVVAHITHSEDIELFLDAGGQQIAHMVVDRELSDERIQRMVEAGTIWIPTMELWNYVERSFYVADFPGYETFDPALENLRRYIAAGGRVALGTDFAGMNAQYMPEGESFQYLPLFELETMVSAGMTTMEAIQTATIHAAQACNILENYGSLEEGKMADILVVDGNPLEDLGSLSNPLLVLREGVIIRNEIQP